MSHQAVRVRREAVAPCMTCPLCHKLFRKATTIIECLHTFCRKCIYKKLSDEEMVCCPICNIDLGCVPLEKLRSDHNLQDVREKIFLCKRKKVTAPEVASPITLPARRKERSLSSLVVSTPRLSTESGMTGRRSKATVRKSARGSSLTIERHARRDDSMDEQPESSSSPETLKRCTQNVRQNSSAGEPSNRLSPDRRRDDHSEAGKGGKGDWKPLSYVGGAASRTKSSKLSTQEPGDESEARDNEGLLGKPRNGENKQKPRADQEEKSCSDHTPFESERPNKMWKVREKKAQDLGEFKVPTPVVLDGASAKSEHKKHPIWFSLISEEWEGVVRPLPQIASSYIRIKDGNMPVSYIQKYLKMKLNLMSEDEVEIKCMGQRVNPALTLNNVVDRWLQSTSTNKVAATVGSSAMDFVMVLGYARKAPDS